MEALLILNAGSSSIKFAAYRRVDRVAGAAQPELIASGRVAHRGSHVEFVVSDATGARLAESREPTALPAFDHDAALARLIAWLRTHRGAHTLTAVGHRVVHGGAKHTLPVQVDDPVLRDLWALVPLAPLHQPHNLRAIELLRGQLPGVPQIACFDTAFHHAQPAVAQAFALPRELTDAGIRRYGFHGLSYESIARRLPAVLGCAASDAAGGRVIVAHLGNGASLCALRDGASVATTMGLTALDGLMMGTRCGSIDPGVLLYLMQERGMSPQQLSDLLYSGCGLLGVSGLSGDMQVLLASTDAHAVEAVELYVYRVVREIGSLAAALGGLDAIVFTAGIGEHAAPIRSRVCAALAWLGVELDPAANAAGSGVVSASGSRVQVAVIPTDEELMIALHVGQVVDAARQLSPPPPPPLP